ncbi:MAG TPA: ACT domain-containing protein, partial [Dermatophilaceae bacterium]|nr:ACT domain-containing protein [Dermatophilaceae bacterium]
LTGPKMVQKIIGINGYDLEIPISQHMAFYSYVDRPGVIGVIGKLLGDASVNIAGMQVSRDDAIGKALVALTVDSAIPAEIVSAIEKEIGAETVKVVDLV